jgi:asparagine synthetase B (glutamine-hydrolysing)
MLDNLASICPDPSCGLGIIPQVLVAKEAAKNGYKYAFTGEGGDEIFTGYNWNRIVFRLAQAMRDMHEDRYMVRYDPMVDHVLKNGFPTLVGGLLARNDNLLSATKRILSIWRDDLCVENNILNINLTLGLPAILTVDEQVGRYAGVEPVSPLMDHQIVEYVCQLKPSERGTIPKHVFREAMKNVLPEKVRMRYDKMGFPVPYEKWHWPMLRPALESLAERETFIDFEIDNYRTMNRQAWALFNVEAWYKKFAS